MKGVVYVSKATVYFGAEALHELSELSSARNRQSGITGYLYFDKGRFVQYVEGERQAVDDLMLRIQQDSRHELIHRLQDEELIDRRFPHWHMRWLRDEQFLALENVLSNHLAWLKSVSCGVDFGQETVWRMIDKLSELQTRLMGRT